MMANTTAAQPLDLDKLQRYSIEYDGAGYMRARSDGEYFKCDEVAALITKARAAQPESATGTTGASVPTWQVRLLAHGFDSAQEAMEAEIADLRAQLAAKGQGKPVLYARQCEIDKPNGLAVVTTTSPGDDYTTPLYLAAPASAQPADVCAEMRALCPNCGGTGDVHRADGEYLGACDCPASAQPDRGAVQAAVTDAMVDACYDHPEKVPAAGKSLMRKTLERALAAAPSQAAQGDDCDCCKDIRAAEAIHGDGPYAPSPASQPVAPAASVDWIYSVIRDVSELDRDSPEDEPDMLLVTTDELFTIVRRHAPVAAVAPSDAKGKADAANAGGRTIDTPEFRTVAEKWQLCLTTDVPKVYAQLVAHIDAKLNQPPAASEGSTSATDAKDAERWRAFIGSARIRPLGSAGLNKPEPNNYAHMGLEIWTKYSRNYKPELLQELDRDNERGREWLIKYADVAIEAQRAAMAAAPSCEDGQ